MRKTVLATITAGALALTACTSEDDTTRAAPDGPGAPAGAGVAKNEAELSAQLEEHLLSSQGAPSWEEASEGWASDVFDTELNGSVLLVHTTFDVNHGGRVDDAERIGEEVIRLISGHSAASEVGRVTVTYYDARGAYSQQV